MDISHVKRDFISSCIKFLVVDTRDNNTSTKLQPIRRPLPDDVLVGCKSKKINISANSFWNHQKKITETTNFWEQRQYSLAPLGEKGEEALFFFYFFLTRKKQEKSKEKQKRKTRENQNFPWFLSFVRQKHFVLLKKERDQDYKKKKIQNIYT